MIDLNATKPVGWHILPHPLISLAVLLGWLLLNGLSLGQLLLGLILAWFIPWICQGFWIVDVRIRNWPLLIRYLLMVLYDIVVANLQTARIVLSDVDKIHPSFFEVPLEVSHPVAIAFLANTITLTPGTISARVNQDCKSLLVHGLNILDVEQTVRDIKMRYERPLLEIF